MDELELVRRHLIDDRDGDDLGSLRLLVAARTWDRPPAHQLTATGPVSADSTDPAAVYAEPMPSEPAAHGRGWRRLAVAAAIVLLLGGVLVGARYGPRRADPAAGPTREALEEALPRLLNDDMALRWPTIAWDASQAEKDAFEAAYRPQMERLVAETYSSTSVDEQRRYAEVGLQRALRGPEPIVDQTGVASVEIDDIQVDANRGEAIVTYQQRVHVLRDPNPPGQLGSFVTDQNGWWEHIEKARVILTWEDGWKLDAVYGFSQG